MKSADRCDLGLIQNIACSDDLPVLCIVIIRRANYDPLCKETLLAFG